MDLPGSLWRLIAVILLVAGAPFACVGAWEAYETQRFISASGAATGTVVDNLYLTTTDNGIESGAYYPVVEFSPGDETIRFQDGAGSLPPDYAVGTRVPVLYDENNPSDARIQSWKRLWLAPTIFLLVGFAPVTVLGVIGAISRWQARARRRGIG